MVEFALYLAIPLLQAVEVQAPLYTSPWPGHTACFHYNNNSYIVVGVDPGFAKQEPILVVVGQMRCYVQTMVFLQQKLLEPDLLLPFFFQEEEAILWLAYM